MRQTLILLGFLGVLLGSAEASAKKLPSPDSVVHEFDLGGDAACLAFVDARAVEFRKDRWLKAIEALWERNPDALLAWIVGAHAPPHSAIAESVKQRDCLIERLVIDAVDPSTRLILDYQKEKGTKDAMASLGSRYTQSSSFRSQLVRTLTESDHRDARTQSWIWKRKFVFSGRNFNFVSPLAAARCGLEARQSWKPDNDAHRRCWEDELTPIEREREILQASAAPGISRHHWGTDFDLFGLNPTLFRTGRYADEYLWMTHNALGLGFFQPYAKQEQRGERYMEERWHWSYYPIAQALLEFAAAHTDEVGEALEELWSGFESRWNTRGHADRRFFDFVRAHWKEFMFNVDSRAVRP